MAAWTYAGFEAETSAAARLTMLRQHIGEVQTAIGPAVSSDGKSKSTGDLVTYLAQLRTRLGELENGPSARQAGGRSRYRPAS